MNAAERQQREAEIAAIESRLGIMQHQYLRDLGWRRLPSSGRPVVWQHPICARCATTEGALRDVQYQTGLMLTADSSTTAPEGTT